MKKQIEDAKTFSENKNERKGLAIIVAGASLTEIQSDPDLKKLFLEAADNAKVVLACRVSPA
jgi:hypothetical protein